LIFDNPVIAQRTHDVADAYLLAMQKVPVRLGYRAQRGRVLLAACRKAWNSAGHRRHGCRWSREHEIAGSNPAAPTYCGGTRAGTGRRPLTAPTQVRFLPPQLTTKRKGKPIGDGSRLESGRAAMPWEFNSPSFRLHVPLAERQRLQPSKLARRVQLSQGTLGDRLMVGCLALNQVMEVQVLLPELRSRWPCPKNTRSGAVAAGSDAWL
jgi:hypothetical protein